MSVVTKKPSRECPFCKSNNLDLSIKKTERFGKVNYQIAYYCKNCRCYGPRVLYNTTRDESRYEAHMSILENELVEKAADLWDNRGDE